VVDLIRKKINERKVIYASSVIQAVLMRAKEKKRTKNIRIRSFDSLAMTYGL